MAVPVHLISHEQILVQVCIHKQSLIDPTCATGFHSSAATMWAATGMERGRSESRSPEI
jgi:hypothetical protein